MAQVLPKPALFLGIFLGIFPVGFMPVRGIHQLRQSENMVSRLDYRLEKNRDVITLDTINLRYRKRIANDHP
jgi:hypothetical protein